MEKKISISQIKEVAQEAYNEVKGSTGGKNADYIPYLANIDSKLFGLSICLMNGQTINIGDTDYRFGIESVSKVHTAILILRQYGAQKVLDMIGADATGLPFNSIIAILLENDHPSTPLVNAGAISACSMVQPVGNSDKNGMPLYRMSLSKSGKPDVPINKTMRFKKYKNDAYKKNGERGPILHDQSPPFFFHLNPL